ncbi:MULTISPECIES: ABC transporter ATP-binding protein [unclassified Kitasatospora]|uniref:ABC transporter ATP-binding protein n=1 Tax=unclassified Kitasatospora TaxID=2633591 RepID=UPI00070B88D2|nr:MULTISPECIES: ABC transporter ATP-binding protein [unclassified Kitasatospora]KQV17333.1 ABC transporter [Kitasatospora sp. Root107]KRB65576.1 ABC transporter [Kitasatospora sp. Root187]
MTATTVQSAPVEEELPHPAEDEDIPVPAGAARRLLGELLGPHRRRIVGAMLVILVQQAALQSGPLLIAIAMDRGIPALREHDAGPLVAVVAAYLGFAALSTVLQRAFIRLSGRINQDILLTLRGRIFRHAQRLSLDFHERYTSGRIISRATSDVDALRELLAEGLQELLTVCLSVFYISIVLMFMDWRLGLAALLSFLPMYLSVRSFRRRSLKVYRRSRTAVASVIVRFTETMNGIRPVQAFRREAANEAAFGTVNRQSAAATADSLLEMARYVGTSRAIANTWITAVVVLGAVLVTDGSLELGALTAFVLYLRRLYDPIDQLAMFLNSYQSAAAALEKIAGLLAHEPSVAEPTAPATLPTARMKGREVTFDGVRFAYRTGKVVLPSFDLTLAAGQTTAVVGATGAGKSTLAKLLARFYDPTEGAVRLDGVDLRSLPTDELRRGVVMVTQESFLFSGTVAENIGIGRPGATRAEIEQAAREIGADEFIAALPEGFDTDVRKRGGRISAGQRQLVAFARALLADPAVLILDEATSSLDVPGEQAVQRAMRTVLAGRTAVIIAHRLSTVEIADRVLVMDQGRIVEDGTPADLISGQGRFADLHQAWRDSLV